MPITQQLLLKFPTVPLAMIVIGISVALALTTTLVAHWIIPGYQRKKESQLQVVIFGINAIIYAILLTLVLFTSWIGFQDAQSNIQKEANCLVELYRNTEAFLPAAKQEIRPLLEKYATSVVHEEWKTLAKSELNPGTILIAKEIWKTYTHYSPKSATEQVFLQESIRKLYELRACRQDRLADSKTGIHPALWFVLLAGEMVTVFSLSLFTEDLRSKLVVTVLFGLLVGIFFFTIILFDFPFTGDMIVSPSAFQSALLSW